MKKAVLLLLLSVATGNLFAQSAKFGISAGLNESTASTFQGSPTDLSMLTGFNAGLFTEFDLNKISIPNSEQFTY